RTASGKHFAMHSGHARVPTWQPVSATTSPAEAPAKRGRGRGGTHTDAQTDALLPSALRVSVLCALSVRQLPRFLAALLPDARAQLSADGTPLGAQSKTER